MNYFLYLLFMLGLYIQLAYSLNLTLGLGGLASFCHAAFYGIGAYAYAILVKTVGLPPGLALAAGMAITGVLAGSIGMVSLRFRGDLFLFVTLGFQMIVFVILYNWVGLTNGPYGISDIPRPQVFGVVLRTPAHYAFVAAVITAGVLGVLFSLYRSPFGATLKALREDEVAGAALGIDPQRMFLQAFVISAIIASIPGALYAAYVTYIDPSSFTLKESIFQIAILLLGGAGNRKGPLVGTVIMLLIPESLRFVGMPDALAHNTREIVYGLLLVGLMYWRPQGIAGQVQLK